MIGRNSVQVDKGVIPNRSRAEQLKICQDKKAAQLRQAKTGRGIQSKLFKGKNKNMDAPVPVNGAKYDAYERVVLREAGFKRPVVIFGPLADITRESLESNHQDRYEIARSDSNATFDSNKGNLNQFHLNYTWLYYILNRENEIESFNSKAVFKVVKES